MSRTEWTLVEGSSQVEEYHFFSVTGPFTWYLVCGSSERVCVSDSNVYLFSVDSCGVIQVEQYAIPQNFPEKIESFLRLGDTLYIITHPRFSRNYILYCDLEGNVVSRSLAGLPISVVDNQIVLYEGEDCAVSFYDLTNHVLTPFLPGYLHSGKIRGRGSGHCWHRFEQGYNLFAVFNYRESTKCQIDSETPYIHRFQHNGALYTLDLIDSSSLLLETIYFPDPNVLIPEKCEVSIDLSLLQAEGYLPQEGLEFLFHDVSPSGSILAVVFTSNQCILGALLYRWKENVVVCFIPGSLLPNDSSRSPISVSGFVFISDDVLSYHEDDSYTIFNLNTLTYQIMDVPGPLPGFMFSKLVFRRIDGETSHFSSLKHHSQSHKLSPILL